MTDTPPGAPMERTHLSEPRAVLAIILIGAAIGATGLLMWVPIPSANSNLADIGLGWVWGQASTAVAYWLGSSKGSADKTAALVGKVAP